MLGILGRNTTTHHDHYIARVRRVNQGFRSNAYASAGRF